MADAFAACAAALPDRALEPWGTVQEAKIRAAIGRVFDEPDGDDRLAPDAKPERWAVVDSLFEVALEAKSDRAKATLRPFLKSTLRGLPTHIDIGHGGASPVDLEWLVPLLAIPKASLRPDKVWKPAELSIAPCSRQGMPLVAETVDWRILIAPLLRGE